MRTSTVHPPRLAIDGLRRKYHNENSHTDAVTKLALQLFDRTQTLFGFSAADRAVLSAAGRLHDLAYSVAPRDHRSRGANLVLREGLQGFCDNDRALIAATMLFHSGDINATRRDPRVSRLAEPHRAARLGALLRVADGLDFGHLQDSKIVNVRRRGKKMRLSIRAPLFPANLTRADEKSDLWRAIFPVGIELFAAPHRQNTPPLLAPNLTVLEAARRLITRHTKLVLINVAGTLRGASTRPLHDVRVSLRRLRWALTAFAEPLAKTSAELLNAELKKLNRALGPARDLDVWLEFLTSPAVGEQLQANRRWKPFLREQTDQRRSEQATLRRCLTSASFMNLRLKLACLTRRDISRLNAAQPPGSLPDFAAKLWGKRLRQALEKSELRHSDSPDKLHKLRIALRKARYCGEAFAPVLGKPFDELTRRIRAAEQAFAKIHDIDIGCERIAAGALPAPHELLKQLAARRCKLHAAAQTKWSRLEAFATKRPIRQRLDL